MVLFGTAQAQVSNYAFSQSVGTYTATSGAATQIIAPNIDDGNSAATNIGFSFTYNGSPFTQFVANSNGHIRLGGHCTDRQLYAAFHGLQYQCDLPARA